MYNDKNAEDALEAEHEQNYINNKLRTQLDWRSLCNSCQFTSNITDLFLSIYQNPNESEQQALWNKNGVVIATHLVKMIDKFRVIDRDVTEVLVSFTDAILSSDPSKAKYFNEAAQQGVDCIKPFFLSISSVPENADIRLSGYVINRAIIVLATLLGASSTFDATLAKSFIRYLLTNIQQQSQKHEQITTYLTALKYLLKSQSIQMIFKDEHGIRSLASLITKDVQNSQILYLIGFSLWLLSFNSDLTAVITEHSIIRKLSFIIKNVQSEKVVRICIAVLKNLLDTNNANYQKEMVGCDLPKIIDILNKRKWRDQDIITDMNYIYTQLEQTIKRLSSFEVYQAEVEGGALNWSPAHTNELFWRENIASFEKNEFALIKRLIDLLTDEDDLVREIACHDLGEFMRFHVDGKWAVNQFNGKIKLMALLQDDSKPNVAKAALLAIQKLMVNNWEALQKSSAGGVASLVGSKK